MKKKEQIQKAEEQEIMQLRIEAGKLSAKEKLCIENSLIDALNTVVMTYKDEIELSSRSDLEAYLEKIAEKRDCGFPHATAEDLKQIIENITYKAEAVGFPAKMIPKTRITLDLFDVFTLTSITRSELKKLEMLLEELSDVMERCGDDRGEALVGAMLVINELRIVIN